MVLTSSQINSRSTNPSTGTTIKPKIVTRCYLDKLLVTAMTAGLPSDDKIDTISKPSEGIGMNNYRLLKLSHF